jgi:hypothetical protein
MSIFFIFFQIFTIFFIFFSNLGGVLRLGVLWSLWAVMYERSSVYHQKLCPINPQINSLAQRTNITIILSYSNFLIFIFLKLYNIQILIFFFYFF